MFGHLIRSRTALTPSVSVWDVTPTSYAPGHTARPPSLAPIYGVRQSGPPIGVWRPFRPPDGVLFTFPSWYFCAISLSQLYLALDGSYHLFSLHS